MSVQSIRKECIFCTPPDELLGANELAVAFLAGYPVSPGHALIVPRVEPRLEQFVRAERLRDLGLLDVLHPDLLHPSTLSAWLRRDPAGARSHDHVDLNGLQRLPRYLDELLASDPVNSGWTIDDALALAL